MNNEERNETREILSSFIPEGTDKSRNYLDRMIDFCESLEPLGLDPVFVANQYIVTPNFLPKFLGIHFSKKLISPNSPIGKNRGVKSLLHGIDLGRIIEYKGDPLFDPKISLVHYNPNLSISAVMRKKQEVQFRNEVYESDHIRVRTYDSSEAGLLGRAKNLLNEAHPELIIL